MSPTGRSYNGSAGYNTAGSYGYTSMSHSSADYSQGTQLGVTAGVTIPTVCCLQRKAQCRTIFVFMIEWACFALLCRRFHLVSI